MPYAPAAAPQKTPDWFRFKLVEESAYHEALAAKRRYSPVEIVRPFPSHDENVLIAYRYTDAVRIVRDEQAFSSNVVAAKFRPVLGAGTMVAQSKDTRERRYFRSVLGSVLGPRHTDALAAGVVAPVVEPVARSLAGRDGFDLVAEVSSVIPPLIIARLLGLPPQAAPGLLTHALAMAGYLDEPKAAVRGARALKKMFREVVAERHREPGDDLVSRLLRGDADGPPSDDDVVTQLILLTWAGTETAFPATGSLFYALLTHPDMLQSVREAPGLAYRAVDELLRWEAPVQATCRSAAAATQVGDVTVPAGTTVFAHLGSANRDIPGIADPERFDIHREGQPRHLAFGLGVHSCIGMHLARLEMAITLQRVLAHCPRLRPGGEPGSGITGHFIRGPVTLPVTAS
jgi:cytochrome P450